MYMCDTQGVITSVDYYASTHQLCTSSDDRSICLWTCASRDPAHRHHRWLGCVFIMTRQLYGHMARVWKAKLLSSGIVSISEVCSESVEITYIVT